MARCCDGGAALWQGAVTERFRKSGRGGVRGERGKGGVRGKTG